MNIRTYYHYFRSFSKKKINFQSIQVICNFLKQPITRLIDFKTLFSCFKWLANDCS